MFDGSHQIFEFGPVTVAVTCVVCISMHVCDVCVRVGVWWVKGNVEEERFCRCLDLLSLSASSGSLSRCPYVIV